MWISDHPRRPSGEGQQGDTIGVLKSVDKDEVLRGERDREAVVKRQQNALREEGFAKELAGKTDMAKRAARRGVPASYSGLSSPAARRAGIATAGARPTGNVSRRDDDFSSCSTVLIVKDMHWHLYRTKCRSTL